MKKINKYALEEFENSLNAMGVEEPKDTNNNALNNRKRGYYEGFKDAIELVKSEFGKFIS
jgi:hypothetical protein